MSKILYLSPGVFDKGGISRYTRFQARALRDLLGSERVTVLSLLPPDAHGFEEPFAANFASFGPSLRGKALFAAAALAAAADRPRVVWAAHVGLGPLALGIARALRAQSVLNIYGIEVWTDLRRAAAAGLRHIDWVVSDCHNTRDYVLNHGLRAPTQTVVHWDCVDTTRLFPGAVADPGAALLRYNVPRAAEGTLTVMTLGRMSKGTLHKGYDRLIDAFARVPRDVKARLVLAGDGERRPALEAQAQKRGLTDRVLFTGRVHEDDMPAMYCGCDVFSLVTDMGPGRGEGIPLTPLEAAACGKPILVGNQDGSREAAEDGVSGFVLDPFDFDAIADRIVRLARDPDLRARMGKEARARVEREHSYPRFRARTADLLREMNISADTR